MLVLHWPSWHTRKHALSPGPTGRIVCSVIMHGVVGNLSPQWPVVAGVGGVHWRLAALCGGTFAFDDWLRKEGV